MDSNTEQPKKKGICCVCKETKAKRDECLLLNSEDQCKAAIEQHNQCLRAEGFDPSKA